MGREDEELAVLCLDLLEESLVYINRLTGTVEVDESFLGRPEPGVPGRVRSAR